MQQAIRSFLDRVEETGKLHDATEPEHAKRFLNLERETAETVVLLMKIAGARNIVEIGTSNGYSTIWIAATMGPLGGRIVSIEKNPEKHSQARENLADLGLLPFVDLRLGDATEVLSGPFDCIFFDADRVSAPRQLDLLVPMLNSRALLMADNAPSHPEEISGYLAKVPATPASNGHSKPIGSGIPDPAPAASFQRPYPKCPAHPLTALGFCPPGISDKDLAFPVKLSGAKVNDRRQGRSSLQQERRIGPMYECRAIHSKAGYRQRFPRRLGARSGGKNGQLFSFLGFLGFRSRKIAARLGETKGDRSPDAQ